MPGADAFFGVEGTLAIVSGSSTLVSTANRLVGMVMLADEFRVGYLEDGQNYVLGARANGRRRRARFTIIPYDAGGNALTAKANVKLPDPLARIQIAGSGLDLFDGYWNYIESATVDISTDGFIQIPLICGQFWSTTANAFVALT